MNNARLEAYLRDLVDCMQSFGMDWIRQNPDAIREGVQPETVAAS